MCPREIIDVGLNDNYFKQISVDASANTWKAMNAPRGMQGLLVAPEGGTLGLRLGFCPTIRYVFQHDVSASLWRVLGDANSGEPSDYDLFDGSKANAKTLVALASADYIYMGTPSRIKGFYVDINATVNNNAAVFAVDYSTRGGWTTIAAGSVSDTSESTGATLAQDGVVTMDTVPADGVWVPRKLREIADTTDPGISNAAKDELLYWTRWSVNNALDNVGILQISAIHPDAVDDTDTGHGLYAKNDVEYNFNLDLSEVTGVFFVSFDSDETGHNINLSWLRRA